MAAHYEVWDYESRNLINSFETEEAAIAFVGRQFELNGPDGVRELAVVCQEPDESGEYEPRLVLEGLEFLASKARPATAPTDRLLESPASRRTA